VEGVEGVLVAMRGILQQRKLTEKEHRKGWEMKRRRRRRRRRKKKKSGEHWRGQKESKKCRTLRVLGRRSLLTTLSFFFSSAADY
jgi:hypothetical protein